MPARGKSTSNDVPEDEKELTFAPGQFQIFEEEVEHQKARDELLQGLSQANELAKEFNVHVETQAPTLEKANENIHAADDKQKDALYISADLQKGKASKYRNVSAVGMAVVGGLAGIVGGPVGVVVGLAAGAALGGGMGQVATSKVRSGIDNEVDNYERRRAMGEKHERLVKEGWMFKTGNLNSSYKRRYFYLFVDRLEYFEKEQLTENDQPKGVAEFTSSSRVWRVPHTTSKPFAFSLVVSEEGGRVFSFAADSEAEMEDWIQKMGRALDSFVKTLVSGPLAKEAAEDGSIDAVKYGGFAVGSSVCLRAVVTPMTINVALLERLKWAKEREREVLKGKGLLYDWKETARLAAGSLAVLSQSWGVMLDHPQRIVVSNPACRAKNHWHKTVSECCVCVIPEVPKDDVTPTLELVQQLITGGGKTTDFDFVWERVCGAWLQAQATEQLHTLDSHKGPSEVNYCHVKQTQEVVLTSDPAEATAFIVRAEWPKSFFVLPQSSKKPLKMVRPVFGFEHQQTGKIITSNGKDILRCCESNFERGEQFCLVADGVMVAVARTKRYLSVRESDKAIELVADPSTCLRLWTVDSTTVVRVNKPKSRHFQEKKEKHKGEDDSKKAESLKFWKPVNDAAETLDMQVSGGHNELLTQGEKMDGMAHRLAMQEDTAETTHRILSKGLFSKANKTTTKQKFRRSGSIDEGSVASSSLSHRGSSSLSHRASSALDPNESSEENDEEFGPSGLTAGKTLERTKKTAIATGKTLEKQNKQLDEITEKTEKVTMHVERNYSKMTGGKNLRTAPD